MFACFRTTFSFYLLLYLLLSRLLVSGRHFPSTCCSTCCSAFCFRVCRFQDALLLLPVAVYLLLLRLPVSGQPSPSARCSACVSSARNCLKCLFKGYRVPTSCRSTQRTRSSSAKRARYSLVQLYLVLHLSYARFHYLSPLKKKVRFSLSALAASLIYYFVISLLSYVGCCQSAFLVLCIIDFTESL